MSPGITVLTVRESFRRFLHSYRQRGKGAEPVTLFENSLERNEKHDSKGYHT